MIVEINMYAKVNGKPAIILPSSWQVYNEIQPQKKQQNKNN